MIYFDKKLERWKFEIDRRIENNGTKKRLRKVKTLPAGTTYEAAVKIANAYEAEMFEKNQTIKGSDGWDSYVDSLLEDKQSWLYKTLASCRHRSESLGRDFKLTPLQLASKMRDTKGRCEVTGLLFTKNKAETRVRQRPFIHSVDRIDSSKGYSQENIRIVCFSVNMAMSNWGEQVFSEIAVGFVLNKYGSLKQLANAL